MHNRYVRFKNQQKSQKDYFSGWTAMTRNNKMQPKFTINTTFILKFSVCRLSFGGENTQPNGQKLSSSPR
jgi:hypothetical protein